MAKTLGSCYWAVLRTTGEVGRGVMLDSLIKVKASRDFGCLDATWQVVSTMSNIAEKIVVSYGKGKRGIVYAPCIINGHPVEIRQGRGSAGIKPFPKRD